MNAPPLAYQVGALELIEVKFDLPGGRSVEFTLSAMEADSVAYMFEAVALQLRNHHVPGAPSTRPDLPFPSQPPPLPASMW